MTPRMPFPLPGTRRRYIGATPPKLTRQQRRRRKAAMLGRKVHRAQLIANRKGRA